MGCTLAELIYEDSRRNATLHRPHWARQGSVANPWKSPKRRYGSRDLKDVERLS